MRIMKLKIKVPRFCHVIGTIFLICLSGCNSLNKPIIENSNYPIFEVKSGIEDAHITGSKSEKNNRDNSEDISNGDLVYTNYIVSREDGEILSTNIKEETFKKNKAEYYQKPSEYRPLAVLAGSPDLIPGIQKIILGMKVGERRKSIIKPEDAFGLINEKKIKKYSSSRSIPDKMSIPVGTYIARYKKKPLAGNYVRIFPYFLHKITEVTEKDVSLEAVLKSGEILSNDSFGETSITHENGYINIRLKPKIGSSFQEGREIGLISSIGKDSFTVDYNHPLAGESLTLEVTAVSAVKKSENQHWAISWNEYEKSVEDAEHFKKPVALILYADWCQWCKKLFSESMTDPRVTQYRNDFIWVKANSDINPDLKERYGQDGFPFIVFLNKKGKVISGISGFKRASQLREGLIAALHYKDRKNDFVSAANIHN